MSTPHINQRNGSTVSLWADAKGVLELGHDDMDGSTRGVTSHQWLRQVGHHKTELDQAEKHLQASKAHMLDNDRKMGGWNTLTHINVLSGNVK